MVHYLHHVSLLLVLIILSQVNPVHNFPNYYFKNHSNICLRLPRVFLSSFVTNILYTFIISPIRATLPAHLILSDPGFQN